VTSGRWCFSVATNSAQRSRIESSIHRPISASSVQSDPADDLEELFPRAGVAGILHRLPDASADIAHHRSKLLLLVPGQAVPVDGSAKRRVSSRGFPLVRQGGIPRVPTGAPGR